MGSARSLVAGLSVRIESGPGGSETDQWFIDVEVGPGVTLRDADALAVALVTTLVGDVGWIAEAFRRHSAESAA